MDADIAKGTKNISGSGINSINNDDWVRLSEYDFPVNDSFAQHRIGQITQLENISGNNAIMKDEASKDYSDTYYNLRLWKIKPILNIGIENLKINRNDNDGNIYGDNIKFSYAVNCWIKGVESEQTCRHHVSINFSSHILVSGSYFNEARYKGDGGSGYGVELSYSTTNCLVENNIFRKLRHAILVQAGANCNVFSYNYSREQDWNYIWQGPDICLHGNYPFGNLFEQNVVGQISADNAHGTNGPYNVFLRNYVTNDKTKIYAPIWLYEAPNTAVLGNETWRANGNPIDEDGSTTSLSIDIYGHFDGADRTHLYMSFYPSYIRLNASALGDVSYYYSSRPYFLSTSYTWPSLGPNYISSCTQSIPAYDRYGNTIKTYNSNPTQWPPQPLAVTISGPTHLNYMQNGTFTANPSHGSGSYTNYRWWWRNDDSGGGPDKFVSSQNSSPAPMYAPPGGTWYILSGQEGNQSITIGKPASFSLKCEVTDSQGHTATDIHSISVSRSFNLSKKGDDEIKLVKESLPEKYALLGAYPNPFNPSTTVKYALPSESDITVSIFNLAGQKVKSFTLFSQPAGFHTVFWDGKNNFGNQVPSGLYIVNFSARSNNAQSFNKSIKIVMLK